jgi:hypothetical protein
VNSTLATTRARLTTWWTTQQPRLAAARALVHRDNWLGFVFAIGGLAVTAVMLYLAYLLIKGLFGLLADAARGIGAGATTAGGHVGDWTVARIITDPIHVYLDQHTAGLPATADQLWWTWLIATGVLLLLSWTGSWGARLGWTASGAAGVAMVFAGTPEASQTLAAGVATLAWALLSVLAFAGIGRTRLPRVIVNNIQAEPEPTPEPDPAPIADRRIHRPSRFSRA